MSHCSNLYFTTRFIHYERDQNILKAVFYAISTEMAYTITILV
jgi:hypothetical protein